VSCLKGEVQFSRAGCAHLVALKRVVPPREDAAPVPLTAARLLAEQREASRTRNRRPA